jgi:hypothetical protein
MIRAVFVLSLVVLGLGGCSDRVATYPVSGTIRFDDNEPVRFGVVEFRNQKSRLCARGKLDDTGSFKLETFAKADGAPAGDYRVVIVQYFNAPPARHKHKAGDGDDRDDHEATRTAGGRHPRGKEPDARVDVKFSDYAKSGLQATVRSDSKNSFDFVVTHPPSHSMSDR